MEAFQLFLGRDANIDIAVINFNNPVVARGRDLFIAGDTAGGTVAAGKCNICHQDAGANVGFIPGTNRNFNTGIENLPSQPADLIDPTNNPPDNGFGNPGNGTFNTPAVIEAADTGPFFHNNSIETIEEAVGFYNGDAFNNSPSGLFLKATDSAGIGIHLETTEVSAIAAFCRALNVLENIRSAAEFLEFAMDAPKNSKMVGSLIKLANADVGDANEVLDCGGLHPKARQRLREAFALFQASAAKKPKAKKKIIQRALDLLESARSDLVEN